jgi:two-component system KDP operon response regulator KdpE
MKTKIILIFHTDFREANQIMDSLINENYNATISSTIKNFRFADMILICWDYFDAAVVRGLRKQISAPIIVFSNKNNQIGAALDAGAHDFLTLPFGNREHFARIRAAFRNFTPHNEPEIFSFDGLSIDFHRRAVISNGKKIHLTPIEFRIISLLAKNQGLVISHEQIINEIWGPFNSDNLVLRVNMANIRKKIEPDPVSPKYIITEKGVGYFFAFTK